MCRLDVPPSVGWAIQLDRSPLYIAPGVLIKGPGTCSGLPTGFLRQRGAPQPVTLRGHMTKHDRSTRLYAGGRLH